MATATAPTIEVLANEITDLEAKLGKFHASRAEEQRTLDRLLDERKKISEEIARGTAKASAVSDHNRKIEQTTAAIEGFNALISEKQIRLDEAIPRLRNLRDEETKRTELAEIEALEAEGRAIVGRVAEVLATTTTGELARYEAVRKRLLEVASRNRSAFGQFPIPPAALRAQEAIADMDGAVAEKLAPILKTWR